MLLADDDADDRALLIEAFDKADFHTEVQCFENGQQLIDFLKHTSELPDLIILDYNMPLVNGLQALREIAADARLQHIPVVLWSTSNNEATVKECIKHGAREYFKKPSNLDGYVKIATAMMRLCVSEPSR